MMPDSRRKIIRKRIVKLLKGATDAGDRVFSNPSVPTWQKDLPAILVFPRTEDATKFGQAPLEFKREVLFGIEIQAEGTEQPFDEEKGEAPTVEDVLDDIAKQVECAMFKDDTLGCDAQNNAIADEVLIQSTEFEFRDGGETPIGAARLNFLITYYEHAPETIDKQPGITDFKKANVSYHVGHDNADPDLDNKEAEDDVEIPQS